MIYIGHARTLCVLLDALLSGALSANKQNLLFLSSHLLDHIHSFMERWYRLLKVYDMNFVASAKDIRGHLWVPITGLVAEMDTGLQHFAHAYCWHSELPVLSGLSLHASHLSNPA